MSPSDEGMAPAAEVVERALALSRADGCVVIVVEGSWVNARFAMNTSTSNGLTRTREVSVVSFVDGPAGISAASVTWSGDVALADLVAASEAAARGAPPAPDAADLVAGGADGDFGEAPATTSHEELASVVAGLASAFGAAQASGIDLASFVEYRVETTYLGSSTGLRRRFVQSTGDFQLNGRADGGRRSAWSAEATSDPRGLDVASHVEEVRRRLEWATRRTELVAGRYETILPPIAVADLTIFLYQALSARDARDGRTVFSRPGGGTRLGGQVSRLPFAVTSGPAEAGLECRPFVATSASSESVSVFDNGAPLARTSWIHGGHLTNLFTPRADASLHGPAAAAPIDNLVLELPGARGDTADLVARTERGLLLTCLWYIRQVDPATLLLTGLTRDGVYLIEEGRVTGAVNNFRFNESPVDVLARTVEAGESRRTISREWSQRFNRTRMPPLRVPDFNMSSVSPAN
jgi:predicted Zn-dependent protease